MGPMLRSLVAWVALAGLIAVTVPAASAQDAAAVQATGADAIGQIVKDAEAAGLTVMLVGEGAAQPAATSATTDANALNEALEVRNALAETLAAIPGIPAAALEAIHNAGGGSSAWVGVAFLLALLAAAIGYAARYGFQRWARSYVSSAFAEEPKNRAEEVAADLSDAVICVLSAVVFAVVALAAALVLEPDGAGRATSLALVTGATAFFFLRDLFNATLGGERSEKDPRINNARRFLVVVAAIGGANMFFNNWIIGLGVDARTEDALAIMGSAPYSILFIIFFIRYRKAFADWIRGDAEIVPAWRTAMASGMHLVAIGYLVIATGLNIERIVTGGEALTGPILGPILAFAAAGLIHGFAHIIIERRFELQRETLAAATLTSTRVVRGASFGGGSVGGPDDGDDDGDDGFGEDSDALDGDRGDRGSVDAQPLAVWRARWRDFWTSVANAVSVVTFFIVLLAVWGLLKAGSPVVDWAAVAGLLFVFYVLNLALKTWIDGKIADEEGPPKGEDEDAGDGMGAGASRLATLLPLFRSVLSVTLIAVAGMVILAGLGVNVAPLFAGAGVIGLAVGFGAQSLIRDIFSGAFFLLDDAFRRGEFIDIGGTMGAVERISLRSFQLRHQNGPLHTIPFGEIKQLTNFSRDWVVMKLPIRLAYGTDTERVRKLIKKLGQQMQADPEIGPLFMQPLKSQGVVEMEDSAMILRVKFMTKPGDQFVLRRHVFSRINDLFSQENIQFAHREVTVRIADTDTNGSDDADAEEVRRQAATGAARLAIEDPGQQKSSTADAR